MKWRGGIPQHGHARDLRRRLLEELQPLHARFFEYERVARDVAAWVREVGHEAAAHGIGTGREDDRDRGGGLHGGPGRQRRVGNDEIHIEPNQLGRQTGQTVITPPSISPLDDEVLSFDITESMQIFPEGPGRIRIRRVQGHHDTDAPHLAC